VFLFVLFIFSFLDRINIGFAGLTMGADLGLNATMFGLATTLFYVTYVLCGIPSNIMLASSARAAGSPGSWCCGASPPPATMFATSPKSLYILRMLVGITEAGFLPGILLYLTWWFPAFRARANALFMIAMPVTMRSSILSGYILAMDGCGTCTAGSGCSCWKGCRRWCSALWSGSGLTTRRKANWLTDDEKKPAGDDG
jgi:ACS family 4-hydroxyphenylacetate permease-like MFS transporter